MSERLDGLKQRLGQLADLAHALSLAHWDQQTMMPPGGGEARAESLATLTRISHEMFVADQTGRVLETMWDLGGENHPMITSMREHKGCLYIGGIFNNRIGRLELSGFDKSWPGPNSYWGRS